MTIRYYDVEVRHDWQGTAVHWTLPAVRGTVLTSVSDATRLGSRALLVMEATDEEHQMNDRDPAIHAVRENEAQEIADRYRPERSRPAHRNPFDRRSLHRLEERAVKERVDLAALVREPVPVRKRTRVQLRNVVPRLQARREAGAEPALARGVRVDPRTRNATLRKPVGTVRKDGGDG